MTDTGIFRVPSTEFVKVAAGRRLWSVAWLPGLLLLAAAIAGFADPRFWYLGLMLLFIIYPMVMSMAWFRMVGHRSMEVLLRPQSWTLDGENLTVRFHFYHPDADGETPAVKESLVLPAVVLEDAESHRRFTVVPLPDNRFKIDFLIIPADSYSALTNTANACNQRL